MPLFALLRWRWHCAVADSLLMVQSAMTGVTRTRKRAYRLTQVTRLMTTAIKGKFGLMREAMVCFE